jgi:tetratricopeptide (TPR) repeat protein
LLAFIEAVQTQPNNIQWRLELAQLCAKADRPEEAIQELEELLKRSPDDACPLEALVRLQLRQRDLSRAVEITERIKAKFPGKPLGHYVSGLIHQANGEWDASVHDFELALEKALDASQPLYKLLVSDNRTRESNAVTLEQGVSTGPMMVIVMAHGCGCWLGQDMAGRGASRPSH